MGDLSGLSSLAKGYADQYKDDDEKFKLFNSISDVLDSIDSPDHMYAKLTEVEEALA